MSDEAERGGGMPAPGQLLQRSHGGVLLRVRDLQAAVAWYQEKLALTPEAVGADGPEHPFAAFEVGGLHLGLWQLPPATERAREEADRNSYVVFTTNDDPAVLREHLRERGVSVGRLQQSDLATFFWFYDPDGNRFEVSRPGALPDSG
jgi:catechol 2,3-dioxygenase-like lactoylglutathione lyase family enzyme